MKKKNNKKTKALNFQRIKTGRKRFSDKPFLHDKKEMCIL